MKRGYIITFVITGLIAGLIFTWQILTDAPIKSSFPTEEVSAKDELLKDYLNEQSYLQSRIVNLREEIDESQKTIEEQSEISSLDLLESLKKDIGLTEVRGHGVVILLDDSPLALREGNNVSDIELIQAADIRDIINVLNAANADAISINNQRIIATSPISSVGTTLLVNNTHIAPPFYISAVGDVGMMIDRLMNEDLLTSLFDRTVKHRLVFEISEKEWVTIPIYNGDIRDKYINLID